MKRLKGRLFWVMTALAVVLVLAFSVQGALAYFTTYATAKGGMRISLGGEKTLIEEEFKDWQKIIQIRNTGETPCYVRVKVLAGSLYTITATGTNWSKGGDGYWYYAQPVLPGSVTPDALVASIKVPDTVNVDFDVVVIEECTPVTCDSTGNPTGAQNADWSRAIQLVEEAAES